VYKSYLEIGVRNFIKGFVSKQPFFGLKGDEFKFYREIVSFIYEFDSTKECRISKQSISNLKKQKTKNKKQKTKTTYKINLFVEGKK
jgi:hypothetical protein